MADQVQTPRPAGRTEDKAQARARQLTRLQKLGLLVASLGKEGGSRLLKQFERDEIDRIAEAIVELEDEKLADEATVTAVLDEFHEVLENEGAFLTNVGRALDESLESLYGAEAARKIADRARESSRARYPFRAFRGLRAADLAQVLMEEHPQVRAIVVANLDADLAAAVLFELPEGERPGIIQRVATMEDPPPRVLLQVAMNIAERTKGMKRVTKEGPQRKDPRIATVAGILNAAPGGTEKSVLEKIDAVKPELSERIRESMFEFKDLVLVDRRSMQKILAGLDTKVLALSLKACTDEVRDTILSAVSQRTREMILEERELIGAVAVTEVLAAQKEIVTYVRKLMDSGDLQVNRGREGAYVS